MPLRRWCLLGRPIQSLTLELSDDTRHQDLRFKRRSCDYCKRDGKQGIVANAYELGGDCRRQSLPVRALWSSTI